MKRARVIIKEVQITRAGEIKNFQIKLPKNTKRIIAIETDVRIDGRTDGATTAGGSISVEPAKPETLVATIKP